MHHAIGNRTWSKRGDYAREYAANELNQMTSRGVPGVAHLLGSADEAATVTVNGQSVTRQDAYWYKDLAVNNASAPQYPEVVIDAAWSNILSSVTGNVFVAETPEDFGYDADGNMTNDGRFAYTWDGENRLIAVETLPAVVVASGAPQVRVEYAYDYMSRRIGKTVYSDFTTNEVYAATNQTAYLYDGWNLVRSTTLSDDGVSTNCYVWGLDLSGSLQGAGGIGGLLAACHAVDPEGEGGSAVSFFTYDANGNVGQLLDAADPTDILAHYEYSPFGETLVSVGDLAKANPFRFSTKYHEDESGLVYYGYRYYNPDLGRWVNRDPIEEQGGVNVYGFVGNVPTIKIDPDGLMCLIPSSGWFSITPSGDCGKADITGSVNAILANIQNTFEGWDRCKKRKHCTALYHPDYRAIAWDIVELNSIGQTNTYWPAQWSSIEKGSGGSNDRCEQTVVYNGQCHKAGAVNYLMWGEVNRLCRSEFSWNYKYSLGHATLAVWYWKITQYWGALATHADMFTRIGYGTGGLTQKLPECNVSGATSAILGPPATSPYIWRSVP